MVGEGAVAAVRPLGGFIEPAMLGLGPQPRQPPNPANPPANAVNRGSLKKSRSGQSDQRSSP